MKKWTSPLTLSVLLAATALTGCGKYETKVDRFYGTSYELAIHSQIANPQAGLQDGAPTGLGGRVAANIIKKYEKGYEQPAVGTKTYSVQTGGLIIK